MSASVCTDGIVGLRALSEVKLREELFRCCGCPAWVDRMINQRPYTDLESLLEKANSTWWLLGVTDWQIAFAAHPKIGDASALKSKFAHSSWEGEEQKGANNASEETLRRLALLNTDYEKKFGFIFLICATGKTALEMVHALENRMNNDAETEVQIAAGEQAKIIQLRILKLLASLEKPIHQSRL